VFIELRVCRVPLILPLVIILLGGEIVNIINYMDEDSKAKRAS